MCIVLVVGISNLELLNLATLRILNMVILKQTSEEKVGRSKQVFNFTHNEQSGTNSVTYNLTYDPQFVGREIADAEVVATFLSDRFHIVNDRCDYGAHRYGAWGPWTGSPPYTGAAINLARIGQDGSSFAIEVTLYFVDE